MSLKLPGQVYDEGNFFPKEASFYPCSQVVGRGGGSFENRAAVTVVCLLGRHLVSVCVTLWVPSTRGSKDATRGSWPYY